MFDLHSLSLIAAKLIAVSAIVWVFWTSNFADIDLWSVCDWGHCLIRDLWNTRKAPLFKLNKSQNSFIRARRVRGLIKCISHFQVQQEICRFAIWFYRIDMCSPCVRTVASWPFWLESSRLAGGGGRQRSLKHHISLSPFLLGFIIQPCWHLSWHWREIGRVFCTKVFVWEAWVWTGLRLCS